MMHIQSTLPFKSSQTPFSLYPGYLNEIQNLPAKQTYKRAFVLGLGGSSLSLQVFLSTLEYRPEVVFIDNLDPEFSYSWVNKFEKDDLLIMVSKSGKTLETLAIANIFIDKVLKEDLPKNNIFAITDPVKSPLRDLCDKHSIQVFSSAPEVGGRFSCFSEQSLIPLSLLVGTEVVHKVLSYGQEALSNRIVIDNLVSNITYSISKNINLHNFWFFSNQTDPFSQWLHQLWSESLGKKWNKEQQSLPNMPLMKVCKGSRDLHSYLQQVLDNLDGQVNWLFGLKNYHNWEKSLNINHFEGLPYLKNKSLSDLYKQQKTNLFKVLDSKQIPVVDLEIEEFNLKTISTTMMIFMQVIYGVGEALNFEVFGQPAIQDYKNLFKS